MNDVMPPDTASANEAYGQLKANLFIAGFTLERGFREFLEPLLAGDAWRLCGGGYADVNQFMDSLRLDKFRVIAQERKAIVQRIKALQPDVSNRQIARTLGVDPSTINQDVAEGNPSPAEKLDKPINGLETASEGNPSPALSGREAAVVVNRRGVTQDDKKARRTEREQVLGAQQRALPQRRYGVIYADPPWRFEPYSRETGQDRAADNHYPTMTLNDLVAIETPAAADCVLFLWATAPMLPEALDVMAAWGFEYRSQCIWAKDRMGTGYWFRSQHEHLLVGTCGNIPAPAMGTQCQSIIHAPVGRHSEKPVEFAEMIESMFPNLPRLEMFAREARQGWDAWGNEMAA